MRTPKGEGTEVLRREDREFADRLYRSRVPYSGSLELTHRCNLSCRHCYQLPPRHAELDTRAWDRLLEELSRLGCLHLSFTGGEPLLRPDLPELLERAVELDFAVTVQTNAVLVDGKMVRILRGLPNVRVDVSLYGARPGTHDFLTRVPGSFAATLRSLNLLREAGVPVILKVTVGNFNLPEMNDLAALAEDLKAEVVFSPLIFPRNDGDPAPTGLRLDDRGLEDFYRLECGHWLTRWRALTGGEQGDPSLLGPAMEGCLVGLPGGDASGRRHCGCGSTVFAVNPYGDVYPCVAFPLVVGNVAEEGFAAVWENSSVLQMIRESDEEIPSSCEDCPHLSICPLCRALSYLEDGAPITRNHERCRQTHIMTGVLSEVLEHEKAGRKEERVP